MSLLHKAKLFSKSLIRTLIQVLLPQSCLICEKYTDLSFCKECFESIPRPKEIGVKWIHSAITYDHRYSHQIMHALKYYNKKSIAHTLAYYCHGDFLNFVETYIRYNNLKDIDQIYLIPIPISKERSTTRGYNQSELIADSLCSFLLSLFSSHSFLIKNINVINTLINKAKSTVRLSHLHDVSTRQEEISHSMYADKEVYTNILDNKIKEKNILIEKSNDNILYVLIDDITTTGSTIYEARRALMTLPAMDELHIIAWTAGH